MKKTLIFLLIGLGLFAGRLAIDNRHLIGVGSIAELKDRPVDTNTICLVVGRLVVGDGGGAFYYWDASALASEVEDMTYLNSIKSNVSTSGIWRRLFVRNQMLPGGMLVVNAGKKEYFVTGVTNSSAEVGFNLTTDNTATGPAIFNTIYSNRCEVIAPAPATVNDAIQEFTKSTSADRKTTVHRFYKGNSTLVSLLGVNVVSFVAAPASVTVTCKVEGF